MQDKYLCYPPYFFLGPAVAPYFLSSRIATAVAWSVLPCQTTFFKWVTDEHNEVAEKHQKLQLVGVKT